MDDTIHVKWSDLVLTMHIGYEESSLDYSYARDGSSLDYLYRLESGLACSFAVGMIIHKKLKDLVLTVHLEWQHLVLTMSME